MAENRDIGPLIGSDKLEGTAVYGADREKIGSWAPPAAASAIARHHPSV